MLPPSLRENAELRGRTIVLHFEHCSQAERQNQVIFRMPLYYRNKTFFFIIHHIHVQYVHHSIGIDNTS